jgi:hypothetical protein
MALSANDRTRHCGSSPWIDVITAEGIARFFEVFTSEVWRRRAEIENAAGGPSALSRLPSGIADTFVVQRPNLNPGRSSLAKLNAVATNFDRTGKHAESTLS